MHSEDREKQGAVASYWDTSEPGPAEKWYRISPTGMKKLEEFRQDIEMRKQNLEYFLDTFNKI